MSWLPIEILTLCMSYVWNVSSGGTGVNGWDVVQNLVHWIAVTAIGVVVFGEGELRLPGMRVPRLVATLLACTIILATLTTSVHLIRPGAAGAPLEPVVRFSLQFLVALAHVAITVATAYAFHVHEANRIRMQTEARLERDLASAELRLLRVQLQPHFLMNALNGVISVVRSDPEEAYRLLSALAKLLRLSLASSRSQWTTVAEEIAFIEAYLELQRFRFGPRVRTVLRSDPAAANDVMPSFLLQPIVENSVRHAVEETDEEVEVGVHLARTRDMLEIDVWNSGPPLSHGGSGLGIGLRNTALRLELLYEGQAELDVTEPAGGGVRTRIRIPLHRVM